MTLDKDLETMTRLAAAGQTATMDLLHAEMQALTALMTGLTAFPASAPGKDDEAHAREVDAATEADFDNMPV